MSWNCDILSRHPECHDTVTSATTGPQQEFARSPASTSRLRGLHTGSRSAENRGALTSTAPATYRCFTGRPLSGRWPLTACRGRGPGFTVRNLRHPGASLAVASGADLEHLKVRMGHESISTTSRFYLQMYEGRDADIAW